MYKLYSDRPTDFKCHIELEGATRDEVDARLVVEGKGRTLMFRGSISRSGECAIPIGKLKGLMDTGTQGTMYLEVIMGETYFRPWKSPFKVLSAKQITVEIYDPTAAADNLSVAVEEQDDIKAARMLAEQLKTSGITAENALNKHNRRFIKEFVTHYTKRNPSVDPKELIGNAIRLLAD